MPHVVTQWQGGEWPGSPSCMQTSPAKTANHHNNLSKSFTANRSRKYGGREVPSLTLRTSNAFHWNVVSPESPSQESSGLFKPALCGSSIFELSSSPDRESLSANPPFIELEDTSHHMAQSKSPAVLESGIVFKTSKPLSRAIVIAIDESIAALEVESKELLNRALTAEKAVKENERLQNRITAAENTAKELRKQNATLRHAIDLCAHNHRPKTAPSRERRVTSTPVSTFNSSTYSGRIESLSQELSPNISTPPTSSLPLLESQPNLRRRSPRRPAIPSEFRDILPPTPATSTFSNSPQSSHRFQSLPPTSNPYISSISSPLPGSVTRNNVMLDGIFLSTRPAGSTISLAEAYRRNKPLPPLRQSSISLPVGLVEIGYGGSREQEQPRKQKSFHNLFRKGRRKKDCGYA
ncbi:hypothetical protein B7463_g900, partial [Scytalidium lignicola]